MPIKDKKHRKSQRCFFAFSTGGVIAVIAFGFFTYSFIILVVPYYIGIFSTLWVYFAFILLVLLAIGAINIVEWISVLVCSPKDKRKEMNIFELVGNTVAKCSTIIGLVSAILASVGLYMVYFFMLSGDTIHTIAEKLVSVLGMSKFSAYTYGMWGGIFTIFAITVIIVLLWIKASSNSCDAS